MSDTIDDGTEQAQSAEMGSGQQRSSSEAAEGFFERSVSGNLSFVGGILGGGIAYAVGLTVMTMVFYPVIQAAVERGTPSAEFGTVAVAVANPDESLRAFVTVGAMGFYNAHGVPIQVNGETGNLLFAADSRLVLFVLLPGLLLFVFGGLVALVKRADGFLGGIVSGSSVVMGYFPLVVAGTVFFRRTGTVDASIRLLPAMLLAGIVFPLVFGGLAGLVKVVVINVFIGGIRQRL